METSTTLGSNTVISMPLDIVAHAEESAAAGSNIAVSASATSAINNECKIRLLDSCQHKESVSVLINDRYSWRGYGAPQMEEDSNMLTLQAAIGEETVGTISVNLDSPKGLKLDQLFKKEIDHMRKEGRRICEFTRLAVDSDIKSKRVLGGLFHVAVINAARVHSCTDICIEVNPRHVRFYQQALNFCRMSGVRENEQIKAPSVLMSIELDYCVSLVHKFGGQPHLASTERSFYPYFFSQEDEDILLRRLIGIQRNKKGAA
ncbi:N-acyl amino acid synthase FeeM domain-containing protein [Undibacterium pigrum]|uniref:N-acyl amino acid synthase FeeM catalytic core domain-containing protein n=1 Tax=Undibacterium pigrum TaxID=401470 RepID=A0A318J7Y4_9BURK|nr:N-acetyltransferase [Undibacterium pigrum]PXX43780.1 hypothetical protein DFR42_10348 [Undibacterium pigrum]